jgi:hypothetical protein
MTIGRTMDIVDFERFVSLVRALTIAELSIWKMT